MPKRALACAQLPPRVLPENPRGALSWQTLTGGMHPAIDAAIQLRNQYQLKPDQIDTINLRVNPLVLELTGKKTPTAGLEGKFSIYHAAAVAIVEGAAGEKQFSDHAGQDPVIAALRTRVVPVVDPAVKPEQTHYNREWTRMNAKNPERWVGSRR
jgi:2-methylcitrate dehydratase PrpD